MAPPLSFHQPLSLSDQAASFSLANGLVTNGNQNPAVTEILLEKWDKLKRDACDNQNFNMLSKMSNIEKSMIELGQGVGVLDSNSLQRDRANFLQTKAHRLFAKLFAALSEGVGKARAPTIPVHYTPVDYASYARLQAAASQPLRSPPVDITRPTQPLSLSDQAASVIFTSGNKNAFGTGLCALGIKLLKDKWDSLKIDSNFNHNLHLKSKMVDIENSIIKSHQNVNVLGSNSLQEVIDDLLKNKVILLFRRLFFNGLINRVCADPAYTDRRDVIFHFRVDYASYAHLQAIVDKMK
jgi:hypothetical protein